MVLQSHACILTVPKTSPGKTMMSRSWSIQPVHSKPERHSCPTWVDQSKRLSSRVPKKMPQFRPLSSESMTTRSTGKTNTSSQTHHARPTVYLQWWKCFTTHFELKVACLPPCMRIPTPNLSSMNEENLSRWHAPHPTTSSRLPPERPRQWQKSCQSSLENSMDLPFEYLYQPVHLLTWQWHFPKTLPSMIFMKHSSPRVKSIWKEFWGMRSGLWSAVTTSDHRIRLS